ncbi:MAG: hypothetical protein C4518_04505 [Desulfobacteraceae bacterium]|nr:MAG: hypothetical protein C4518_04505 [Desulfobacteraceae bacterium]
MGNKNPAISELEAQYGRVIKPQELAEYLKIDKRTVTKFARYWGGIETYPGGWRFFEKIVNEKLESIKNNNEFQSLIVSRPVIITPKKIPERFPRVAFNRKLNERLPSRRPTNKHGITFDRSMDE